MNTSYLKVRRSVILRGGVHPVYNIPPCQPIKNEKEREEITESLNIKRELADIFYKVVYLKASLDASCKGRNEEMSHSNQRRRKMSGMVKRVWR
jgi:hypothetical protein